jgi:hypothetical protein
MEAAKKFYLVDERTYNSTKNVPWQRAFTEKFQEASWSKPADKRSKNTLQKDMHSLLQRDELSDDVKAKLYNQGFIRVQNTNNGMETQPVGIKREPVHEISTTTTKRTKRKSKDASAWEDLATVTPREDLEYESWEKILNKKKKKVVSTPVRRSSRQKKVIKWDAIYDA